ncbi:hypothetical protein [Bifidobacterium leontopitheci]|uniref:Uncharacterized protein n=1 Tax=Bifidobacterium leontopitheci TaxID=2650774 RepID=A0A6I1GDJ8_9BIFI|nr:hypothetical protein [Bifidobacterium leontopitheci]KAB7789730.1 hypothetical protein F7D09_1776 [Bifidobacterium leontopitheci]
MDEKTLVDELGKAQTVDEVLAAVKEAGRGMTYEQADELFGRINQTKCDAAELSGDTIEKIVRTTFGI